MRTRLCGLVATVGMALCAPAQAAVFFVGAEISTGVSARAGEAGAAVSDTGVDSSATLRDLSASTSVLTNGPNNPEANRVSGTATAQASFQPTYVAFTFQNTVSASISDATLGPSLLEEANSGYYRFLLDQTSHIDFRAFGSESFASTNVTSTVRQPYAELFAVGEPASLQTIDLSGCPLFGDGCRYSVGPGLYQINVFGRERDFTIGSPGGLEAFRGWSDAVTFEFAAAPEPSAWALMIGGFGLAGVGLRRRQMVAT